MNGHVQEKTARPPTEPVKNVVPRASLLRRLAARRSTRRLQRAHQEYDQRLEYAHPQYDQRLTRRVLEIMAGCGLSQADYSIGGGRSVHLPKVVSVVPGPPVMVAIKLLPGQTPDDVAAHASAIAFHLGVAGVRVIPLPPSLIRLELLSELA
jgi:hypothetical protein